MPTAALPTVLVLALIQSTGSQPLNDPATIARAAESRAQAERLIRDLEWEDDADKPWWSGSLLERLRQSHVYVTCDAPQVPAKAKAKGKQKPPAPAPTPIGCTQAPEDGWHAIDGDTLEALRAIRAEKREAARKAADAKAKSDAAAAKAKTESAAKEEERKLRARRGKSAIDRALGHRPRGEFRITRRDAKGALTEKNGTIKPISDDKILFRESGDKTSNEEVAMHEIVEVELVRHLTSEFWCSDVVTVCWNSQRPSLSGLRLLLEPNFSVTVPIQGENGFAFSTTNIANSVAVGLEVNLAGAWLSHQAFFLTPHASELTSTEGPTAGTKASVKAKAGVGFGFSTLNGALAVGYGFSFWDRSTLPDFANTLSERRGANSNFLYISIAPGSLSRTAIVGIKEWREKKKAAAQERAVAEAKTEQSGND